MNGQISEQPLAELIREISAKRLSGSLRVAQDRIKVVLYFPDGKLLYAASNVRSLRLAEYLQKSKLVSDMELARFKDPYSDLAMAESLCAQNLLATGVAEQIQVRQVSDVLRVALLWTEGTWEFDHRSQLHENVNFKIDTVPLLLEAGRRMPPEFVRSRFKNPREIISLAGTATENDKLLTTEGFLLSRLQEPTGLDELIPLSGMLELDALRTIYALALSGFLLRQNWKNSFRSNSSPVQTEKPIKAGSAVQNAPVTPDEPVVAEPNAEEFLTRVSAATTHYEVLNVANKAQPGEIKHAYYELARRFHPDRFRMKADDALHARIESAFARITQAYETLMDQGKRATHDSKLAARARTQEFVKEAPKATAPPIPVAQEKGDEKTSESSRSNLQQAEINFKEGYAALQQGLTNSAIGLLSSAARSAPNEPRYRAYYGHALAANETTRRRAEAELQAALKLEPNNGEFRLMLAQLYRDLGFGLRARGEAERAVAADPNNRKARELLRSLE